MGTKADFYTKDGDVLTWHGSIENDGSERHIPDYLINSSCNEEFLLNLDKFLKNRHDAKLPDKGWPWFYPTSKLTEFSYIMWEEKGAVFISAHNSPCYTIYNYKDYHKRSKDAESKGKTIEDWKSFIAKVSPFTPAFPKMRR